MHWASERPNEVIEKNLHVTKATAWVALSAQGVIGPFWFCNEDGATETVTADRHECAYSLLTSIGTVLRP